MANLTLTWFFLVIVKNWEVNIDPTYVSIGLLVSTLFCPMSIKEKWFLLPPTQRTRLNEERDLT